MVVKMILSMTLILAAMGSAHSFELNGFKGVNFGADREVVTAQGLTCKVDPDQRVECSGNETLFGVPSSVRAWFRNEKVSVIRLVAVDSRPVDLVDAYTKALGKPKKYVERRGKHDLTVHYWVAKNGTSVSTFGTGNTLVAKNPDTGEEKHFASADYLDKEATALLLANAKKAEQLKRDF